MDILFTVGAVAAGALALILGIRFVKGPTASDRVLAADGIDTLTSMLLVFYAIVSDRSIYLDIAIVVALLGFISTVFVGRYLEGRK